MKTGQLNYKDLQEMVDLRYCVKMQNLPKLDCSPTMTISQGIKNIKYHQQNYRRACKAIQELNSFLEY
jgi:hypothetical protein